jgi:hypothetical protein
LSGFVFASSSQGCGVGVLRLPAWSTALTQSRRVPDGTVIGRLAVRSARALIRSVIFSRVKP